MQGAAIGLILAGCLGTLALGDLRADVPLFFSVYACAFAGYILAIGSVGERTLAFVAGWGLVFRAVLVAAEPTLSDDVYRYVWDGLVQQAGINPYLHAPASDALSVVGHDEVLARVNHPHLPTIYPPLAQFLFRLCAAIHPDPVTIKLAVCAFDCLALLFLAGLARSFDMPATIAIVYFWNPLVLVEGAGHGHVDHVGVALLVVAVLYARLHGYGRAGAALGLAALTKLLPAILLPAFWRWAAQAEADGRSTLRAMFTTRAVTVPVVFTLVVAAGYAPYADAGWSVLGSLGTYAQTWSFNAPAYGLLEAVGLDGRTARLVLGGCLAAGTVAVSVSRMPPVQSAYYVTGLFLALTPTLHPWYVVWIVPFLCFYGNRGWIALSGIVVLGYHVLIGYHEVGVWEEAWWVRWVIVGVSVGVWAWGARGARRGGE